MNTHKNESKGTKKLPITSRRVDAELAERLKASLALIPPPENLPAFLMYAAETGKLEAGVGAVAARYGVDYVEAERHLLAIGLKRFAAYDKWASKKQGTRILGLPRVKKTVEKHS